MKVTVNEKIETIDNKIKQNKAEYNLDRQTAKISPLSSGNVSKYQFLTGKDVLPEKGLLEEAVTMKGFHVTQRIKSTNWYCKETVSTIIQYFRVWKNN